MVTRKTALNIASDFVEAVRASGFPLKKAILFGSFAREEQHEWSDIDLALVADEFTGVGFFDIRPLLSVKISDRRFSLIEPHTFQTGYFENDDPLVAEIRRTGIVVC